LSLENPPASFARKVKAMAWLLDRGFLAVTFGWSARRTIGEYKECDLISLLNGAHCILYKPRPYLLERLLGPWEPIDFWISRHIGYEGKLASVKDPIATQAGGISLIDGVFKEKPCWD
jgi:hypothetical protein